MTGTTIIAAWQRKWRVMIITVAQVCPKRTSGVQPQFSCFSFSLSNLPHLGEIDNPTCSTEVFTQNIGKWSSKLVGALNRQTSITFSKRWYHQQQLLIETITRYRENSVWSNWIQNGFVQKWWAPLMATIWALIINIDKLINLGCIRPSSMGFPQPFLHQPQLSPPVCKLHASNKHVRFGWWTPYS